MLTNHNYGVEGRQRQDSHGIFYNLFYFCFISVAVIEVFAPLVTCVWPLTIPQSSMIKMEAEQEREKSTFYLGWGIVDKP